MVWGKNWGPGALPREYSVPRTQTFQLYFPMLLDTCTFAHTETHTCPAGAVSRGKYST